MRSRIIYPFMLIIILLGTVGLVSLRLPQEGSSPNNIMFISSNGNSTRITIDDISEQMDMNDISVYDVWLGTTKKYSSVRLYDIINYYDEIPDEDIQHTINVILTNIQGKTVSIPLKNIIDYQGSFLLAVKYHGEDLQIDFSNYPESGGPAKLIIDYNEEFLSENFGPDYWLWCVYKISMIRGPIA